MKYKLVGKIQERISLSELKKDKYEIVGVEIRNRRIKLMLTLDSLADGICSLSYLCKIETNKIDPNETILRELCHRLELSNEQVDKLLNLRDVLKECIEAFLNQKYEIIDDYYNELKELENYRSSIIKLIYFIVHHELSFANEIYLELMQIAQSMREFDFIIFSLFSAILHYYNFRFNEAIEILNSMDNFQLSTNEIIIKDIYLFKASFGANKSDTVSYYDKAMEDIFVSGPIECIEELRYQICLYYLKNRCNVSFDNSIKTLRNQKYIDSLNIIKEFRDKNISYILNSKSDNLTDYARMLRLYVLDINEFESELNKSDTDYYIYDFDYNLLYFLLITNKPSFQRCLLNILIPRICISDDDFIKKYVLDEVIKLPILNGRNRIILKTCLMLHGFDDGYSQEALEYYEKN